MPMSNSHDVFLHSRSIKNDLTRDQYRLYELIWTRFVACQMTPEITETLTVNLEASDYLFKATGNKVLFPGFTIVEKPDKSEKNTIPPLKEGDMVDIVNLK
jgi:DNA topoisomerase-1